MCGIAGILGPSTPQDRLMKMVEAQTHRGPDASGIWASPTNWCALGHRRLSILDLTEAGRQPMSSPDGRYWITYNGEIYNYLELREELGGKADFRTETDTEVLLQAYARWGTNCLDHLIGMFAFAVWDEQERRLFAARDRFGVKPFFFAEPEEGGLCFASEIKALHAAGVPREPDPETWATYLATGMYDHGRRTFWKGISRLLPGECLTWQSESGNVTWPWYDPAEAVLKQGSDTRSDEVVGDELLSLLEESIRLRFRSDVPVGVCLSGGFDSSLLLGLIHRIQGQDSEVKTFTFYCGDPAYDETPWVRQMLEKTRHPACFCRLRSEEVPDLAAKVMAYQDEPYGGFPTLGMAKVHERARTEGVTVLLDGNGLDEGWAGYDYYARAGEVDASVGPVQGSRSRSVFPECLKPEFAARALSLETLRPFSHPLENLQYRDLCYAKIPRGMRFADRVSMMYSRELREPFLDHRIVELGLRQPKERKIRDGQGKWLPRRVAEQLLPEGVREAPKRPVQTPQREWLRGPLAGWAGECIETGLNGLGKDWLDARKVRALRQEYHQGTGDNSFPIWQWITLGLMNEGGRL